MVSRPILHRRSEGSLLFCHYDITSSSHLYSGYGPMLFIQTRALLKQKRSTEALPRSSRTIVLFLRKGMLTSGVLAAEVQQDLLDGHPFVWQAVVWSVIQPDLSRRPIFNVFHVSGCSCTLHSICSWERCRKNGKYTSRFILFFCRRKFAMCRPLRACPMTVTRHRGMQYVRRVELIRGLLHGVRSPGFPSSPTGSSRLLRKRPYSLRGPRGDGNGDRSPVLPSFTQYVRHCFLSLV